MRQYYVLPGKYLLANSSSENILFQFQSESFFWGELCDLEILVGRLAVGVKSLKTFTGGSELMHS